MAVFTTSAFAAFKSPIKICCSDFCSTIPQLFFMGGDIMPYSAQFITVSFSLRLQQILIPFLLRRIFKKRHQLLKLRRVVITSNMGVENFEYLDKEAHELYVLNCFGCELFFLNSVFQFNTDTFHKGRNELLLLVSRMTSNAEYDS